MQLTKTAGTANEATNMHKKFRIAELSTELNGRKANRNTAIRNQK